MTARPILLLTRPQAQSKAFAATCRAAGWRGDIEISPILAIVPVAMPMVPASGTTLIFTSANGVEQASAQHDLTGFRAVAVGDRTARAARTAGMICDSAGGDVTDLFSLIAGRETGALLHLRGAHSTGNLAERLRAMGFDVGEQVVYDQVEQTLCAAAMALLQGEALVVLPLFSPRSASLLRQATRSARAPLCPIAISPATASAWGDGPDICTVSHPNGAEMVQKILEKAQA